MDIYKRGAKLACGHF